MAVFLLLVIELLVSFEELIFLEIFGLRFSFRLVLGRLNKDVLYSLLTKLNLLLSDDLDLFGGLWVTVRHFLRQGRVFSHHDLYIFFFLHLNQFSSLVCQVFVHSSLDFLLVEASLFLELAESLLFALSLALPFFAGLSLLYY